MGRVVETNPLSRTSERSCRRAALSRTTIGRHQQETQRTWTTTLAVNSLNNHDSISDTQIFLFNSRDSDGRCRADVAQLRFRKSEYERELETRRRDQGHELRGGNEARQKVDQHGMRC